MSQNSPAGEIEVRVRQVDGYRFEVAFDKPFPEITVDEPPPLGHDAGPNAARLLAAAIGNCLAASLVFCLAKRGARADGIHARVWMTLVRTPERRLRIGRATVHLVMPPELDEAAVEACRSTFEDFCTVTASVRAGIPVDVVLDRD